MRSYPAVLWCCSGDMGWDGLAFQTTRLKLSVAVSQSRVMALMLSITHHTNLDLQASLIYPISLHIFLCSSIEDYLFLDSVSKQKLHFQAAPNKYKIEIKM